MHPALPFGEVLDAIEHLSHEEQETLVHIVRRRIAERERQRIVRDVEEGEREFAAGRLKPMSVEEIMDDINL